MCEKHIDLLDLLRLVWIHVNDKMTKFGPDSDPGFFRKPYPYPDLVLFRKPLRSDPDPASFFFTLYLNPDPKPSLNLRAIQDKYSKGRANIVRKENYFRILPE